MPPRAAKTSNVPVSRRVAVLVTHRLDNNTKTTRTAWTHELPLLEAVHGEGNITEIPDDKLNEHFHPKPSSDMVPWNRKQDALVPPAESLGVGFVFTGDVESEYDRLCNVYGKHPDVNMSYCEHVYGRFQSGKFSELVIPGSLEDMPAAQLRQLVRAYGYVPVVEKDSTPEFRKEAIDRHKEVSGASRERLIEIITELEGMYA